MFLKNDFEIILKKREEFRKKYEGAAKISGDACTEGANTWHDNFAYEQALIEMKFYSELARKIDKIISHARIVGLPKIDDPHIRIGSIVKIKYEKGDIRWIRIGSYDVSYLPTKSGETPEEAMSISYASPLGKALIGAQEGEERSFTIDVESKKIEVLETKNSLQQ